MNDAHNTWHAGGGRRVTAIATITLILGSAGLLVGLLTETVAPNWAFGFALFALVAFFAGKFIEFEARGKAILDGVEVGLLAFAILAAWMTVLAIPHPG